MAFLDACLHFPRRRVATAKPHKHAPLLDPHGASAVIVSCLMIGYLVLWHFCLIKSFVSKEKSKHTVDTCNMEQREYRPRLAQPYLLQYVPNV